MGRIRYQVGMVVVGESETIKGFVMSVAKPYWVARDSTNNTYILVSVNKDGDVRGRARAALGWGKPNT